MTLTEFLTARLDDDEAVARADLPDWLPAGGPEGAAFEWAEDRDNQRQLLTVSSARVLAEVAAKRAIVQYYTWDDMGDEVTDPDNILAHLAAVYADHDDYDEDWRP